MTDETHWGQAFVPLGGAGRSSSCPLAEPAWLPWPSMVPSLSPEPDNDAHLRSSSRPCSPVHHHEGHAKLSSSPPRASPVRMAPSYVLKKGSVGTGEGGSTWGWECRLHPWLPFSWSHVAGGRAMGSSQVHP